MDEQLFPTDILTKACTVCGERKPYSDFPMKSRSGRPQSWCHACKRIYNRAWYERNRTQHLITMKEVNARRRAQNTEVINAAKAVPCMDCGGRFPSVAMDFDHVRGTKVSNVSLLRAHAVETIREEIAKCDVVCSNCHRIRTAKRLRAR